MLEIQEAADYSELLLQAPRECWIALNRPKTRIVATGKTMLEAVEEAQRNGEVDPFLIWAPRVWGPFTF